MSKAMQVILTEDIDNLGGMGDIVRVKPGYARNFLFPRGFAMPATKGRVKEMAHKQRMIDSKKRRRTTELEAYAQTLNGVQVEIPMKVGEEDKIHGTVTNTHIAEALAKKGYEVDRRKIQIDEPIRSLGLYNVNVRLSADVSAELKVLVTEDKSE